MSNYTENELAQDLENQEYKFGFVTDIETDTVPIGLNEDIIRLISTKKNEPSWLLDYRLKSFAIWREMTEPEWAHVHYQKPDFQAIAYYSAPKQTKKYESWDDVDPELKETMKKLNALVLYARVRIALIYWSAVAWSPILKLDSANIR